MKMLHFLKRIGLIQYSDDEIDEYYASKEIIKKYGKIYKMMMRRKKFAAK